MMPGDTAKEIKAAKSLALLTSSRLRAARRCQRLHFHTFKQGYRPVLSAAVLRFGTLIHLALEAWWKAKMAGAPVDHWLFDALKALEAELDLFERARAQVLIAGYHERWKNEPFEVLGVELTFRTPLVNPMTGHPSRTWELAGKLDVLVRDLRDGLVKFIEHKTSSEDVSPGSDYWKRLRLDGQVSIYFEGAKALGYEAAACIYDVVGKPRQQPGKATPLAARKYTKDGRLYAAQRAEDESVEEFRERMASAVAEEPHKYFARGEVVRLEQELADGLWDIWTLGAQLREAEFAKRAPRNPDACLVYGSTCSFWPVCSGEASLEDTTKYVKSDDVHPELAEAPDASAA